MLRLRQWIAYKMLNFDIKEIEWYLCGEARESLDHLSDC